MSPSRWTAELVRDAFQATFPDASLFVVSNRQPYAHCHVDGSSGEIDVSRPAGGLTLALDPVMRALGGTWIAWGHGSADREVVDEHDRVRVPPEDPAYTIRRLWLDESDVENYYLGYSNQALWPLCHNLLEHVRFRDRYWDAYRRVNAEFAHAVVDEVSDRTPGLIWFQDYHLGLAARGVRDVRSDLRLAQFWHTPWPAWETFRVCPHKVELLEGLLANDLLGFHLDSFVSNFLGACVRELDAFVDWGKRSIVHRGQLTAVRSFPISIDVERFEEMAGNAETEARIDVFKEEFGLTGQKIGLGVDRLDYSKGILERLEAIRILFRVHPEWIGKLTFVQIAVPSRSEIPAYQNLEDKVDERIAELDASLETDEWRPIVYIKTPLGQDELVAFYRMADVILVSSVQDGMNLVVKEFIASQSPDHPGAVCLSEFAGAAEEAGAAISINPFYTEGFAEDIHLALTMPEEERRRRIIDMQRRLRDHTIYTWMANFVAAAGVVEKEAATIQGPT